MGSDTLVKPWTTRVSAGGAGDFSSGLLEKTTAKIQQQEKKTPEDNLNTPLIGSLRQKQIAKGGREGGVGRGIWTVVVLFYCRKT